MKDTICKMEEGNSLYRVTIGLILRRFFIKKAEVQVLQEKKEALKNGQEYLYYN